jgi:hypothetical protein
MSGYSSHDLKLSRDVTFVEKPFTPDEIIAAVRQVVASPAPMA